MSPERTDLRYTVEVCTFPRSLAPEIVPTTDNIISIIIIIFIRGCDLMWAVYALHSNRGADQKWLNSAGSLCRSAVCHVLNYAIPSTSTPHGSTFLN